VGIFREEVLSAGDAQWTAAYARVSGALPLDELVPPKGPRVLYLQTEIDVRTPGKVGLKIEGPEAFHLWIGDQPVTAGPLVTGDLPAGRHKVTVRIDPASQTAGELRVELTRMEGSKAEAFVVGGP
jgi:hypothetical protein